MKEKGNIDISIVIPAYDEEKNVSLLYERITNIMPHLKKKYEIIFVDDGSNDNTFKNLERLNKKDKRVKIIKFRKNFGQTAALDAGFKFARGRIVIGMDADLQDEPAEIPRFLKKLEEGYDVVGAWRFKRQDSFSKKIFSKFASLLRLLVTRENVHDSGTTFRAYRKECLEDLNLFGEMHRYIPYLLIWKGFRFTEIKVKHHRRKFGRTKYNFKRLLKGFLDLFIIKFWMRYSARPIHLFGGVGLLMGLIGFIIALYLTIIRLFYGQSIANRPLLLMAALLIILGVQFFVFGVLADIMVKLYYGKDKKNYNIEKIIN